MKEKRRARWAAERSSMFMRERERREITTAESMKR